MFKMNFPNLNKQYQWSAFSGYAFTEFSEVLESVLNKNNIQFNKLRTTVPMLQRFFLGGGSEGIEYQMSFKNNKIGIQLIPAFTDPITKLVFGVVSSERKIKKMQNVCVVQIFYRKHSLSFIRKIMSEINSIKVQNLWDLKHHPRFQTGLMLSYRTRKKWVKLIS